MGTLAPTAVVGPVLPAHGIGGATDLPIPLPLAVVAGTAALVVSFAVLALAWRTPRYDGRDPGRALPRGLARVLDSSALRWTLRVLGLVVGGDATWALVAGPDRVVNPVFGVFYVVVWVGVVPASLLLGPVVRAVSPLRTLHLLLSRVTGGDPARGVLPWSARIGCWPAALGLFAFVWQELCNPASAYLLSIRLWLAAYAAVLLLGAALLGDRWFAAADPFEVLGSLVARLSPWGRGVRGDDDRVAVRRSPLAQLAHTPTPPGLVAVVSVLFGSTGFDSFKETQRFLRISQHLPGSETLQLTAGLVVFCLVVAVTFSGAAALTGVLGDTGDTPLRRLPALFAPTLVPIIVGYFVAHYLTYFIEQGQLTLIQLSDPMVRGDDLLGTADWGVWYGLSEHPTLLATVKVLAIVAGHIVGAVAAHDRALAVLRSHRTRGQLPMLLLMVAYTATGLFLLFSS